MFQLQVKSILAGFSSSENLRREGEFGASLAIDPILPDTDGGIRPSGIIRPSQMTKFSGANVNSVPLFILTNPKNTKVYVVLSNGRVISYNNSLGSETLIGTLTGDIARGAAYYDNYLYIARTADIARYGPLDGTPSLTQDYWTNTLGLAALRNETYPSINGVTLPNHFMWRHTDNKLYVCDVLSSNKGALHTVKTTKTTVEGDTNDGSSYNSLDLQHGWWPIVGCSFGTYVLVAFIEGTSITVNQKPARLILWDTVSDSFEDVTIDKNFKEPLITALQPMDDGSVMIFSGKASGGCRIDRFYSLNAVQHIGYIADAYPPLPGAVDFYSGRTAFGSKCTVPATAACVFAQGSPLPEMPMGLHNILKSTLSGNNPQVTALKYVQQDDADLEPIIGAKDDSNYQMEKLTTNTGTSLTVKAYFDNGSSSKTVATIDNTSVRFASNKTIDIKSGELRGKNDFYLQFEWGNGAIYRTEKEIINREFNIDRIKFNLASALPAKAGSAQAFLGAIEMPIDIWIDDNIT